MQRPRVRTPGWAAFDCMHREKLNKGLECAMDPDPSISKITSTGPTSSSIQDEPAKRLMAIQSTFSRSFSSVVRSSTTSANFPVLNAHKIVETQNGIAAGEHPFVSESKASPNSMLKKIHSWADENLIEDILAAVNDDVGRASFLLNEMVLSETETKTDDISLSTFVLNDSIVGRDICSKESSLVDNNAESISHNEQIMGQVYVPVEPEWEEDDVYLIQRKEAIKKMREASQHSRAASNAYLRGDHLSALHFSSRAQEEWMAANKLNSMAAEEILYIRNSGNDIWNLDLHGLHTTEAVLALKQHLERIESKMLVKHSSSSNGLARLDAAVPRNASVESLGELQTNNQVRKSLVPQRRQTNHSPPSSRPTSANARRDSAFYFSLRSSTTTTQASSGSSLRTHLRPSTPPRLLRGKDVGDDCDELGRHRGGFVHRSLPVNHQEFSQTMQVILFSDFCLSHYLFFKLD
ncbi:hypothetical protein AXF42_Ash002468 [Apostasia shenzhenica]|uniref:Smr domain-containing protein n=1 Tax=Apostasia shenzhenica TaxID=1088818 RepID=A0A2I0ANP9_9ASPA|nr:hypothetical protein AXF42_Ash002468 [Apostasia shenzhenica]